ncbi:MAG: type III-A CRISPR-associated protein Csm2 [Pseudomonadota bacterium]|nr:type III-A CRISPR-associated protein Csm2 [Pseudomonadota bacterium]
MSKPPPSAPRPPAGKGPAAKTAGRPLPSPTLQRYYRDDGRLRPELLDSEAEAMARRLHSVSSSQLRRFYQDVVNLRQRLPQDPEQAEAAWEDLRAEVRLLKARVVYAHGRSEKNVPPALLRFFIDHLHSLESARDFAAFFLHFQAVVAYHGFVGKKDEP